MADSKITALAALTAADPVNDMFPVVDVSDTSMAASGTTKRISANNILSSSPTASGALTVTGLVTAGSATITGDLTVDTNVLKVDTTNNRVGIGAASPATRLDVNGGTGGIGGQTHATFSGTAGRGLVISTRSDSASADRSGVFDAPFTGGTLAFQTLSTDRMVIDASANVNITSGNVVMGTSGKGIDFSATANSSGTMTSELLNDYEEGTWTGTLKGSVSNPTVAVTATGKYTKVGRQVTVNINYNNVSTVGASGNVTIDGLPFTGSDNFAGSSIAFDLFAISTTLASWNAGTEIEFFITGAYVKATHNPGTGRYLTTTLTYIV